MPGAIIPITVPYERPAFIDALGNAYNERGKGVVVLTGDTRDLYWSKERQNFLDLDRVLYQALNRQFHVLRMDIATGLTTFSDDDADALQLDIARADGVTNLTNQQIGKIKELFKASEQSPLAALILLRDMLKAVGKVRSAIAKNTKPVCTIVQFAGSLFPQGDFDKLNELDRQRLVTFLSMVDSPMFKDAEHLVILVASTASEVNSRIGVLPSSQQVVIDLPNMDERRKYVDSYKNRESISFEGGVDAFITVTAGLQLNSLHDLLETAPRTKREISRKEVLAEINVIMQMELGDIIKLSRPEHTSADIIGYKKTTEFLHEIFRRCRKAKTAIPVILVPGPNGAGKTFQLEAHASESGRVVIELTGLRSMYFGQTDALFEKLRLHVRTFGEILILVDEAHTAFGSVHKSDTHETEKRLAGNVIKMMSDKTLFGKVVWALMSSRPDELDPDVKSRAAVQLPIFDTEGEERAAFVKELFNRNSVECPEGEFDEVLAITKSYSNRDYDYLIKEVIGSGKSALMALKSWNATNAIKKQRRLQTLLAAQHCSYPDLLPSDLKDKVGEPAFEDEIQALKTSLHY